MLESFFLAVGSLRILNLWCSVNSIFIRNMEIEDLIFYHMGSKVLRSMSCYNIILVLWDLSLSIRHEKTYIHSIERYIGLYIPHKSKTKKVKFLFSSICYYQTEPLPLGKSKGTYFLPLMFIQGIGVCPGFPHRQSLPQNGSKCL